jgi:hypothetical protein
MEHALIERAAQLAARGGLIAYLRRDVDVPITSCIGR